MFQLISRFFRPKSKGNIGKEAAQLLHKSNKRGRGNLNTGGKNSNARGPVNMTRIPLNKNRMNRVTLANLLNKVSSSKNSNPTYKITENKIQFTLPFETESVKQNMKNRLTAIRNTKLEENKGEFANASMQVNTKNNTTLVVTLSSSKKNLSLPVNFVKKLFGADVPLDKKKVTKENVIQWSKYRRGNVSKVGTVGELITSNQKITNGNTNDKLYGPGGLWETHGVAVAEAVERIKGVLDSKNLPNVIPKPAKPQDILYVRLQQAMNAYLEHEKKVYIEKTEMDVKPLYEAYRNKPDRIDILSPHLPKFCTIPYDWRVHCVHQTMTNPDTTEPEYRSNWYEFLHIWNQVQELGTNENISYLIGQELFDPKRIKNNMNENRAVPIKNQFSKIYAFLLRNYRPFLSQSLHTIGSIRYPHTPDIPCPLTKNDSVWKYKLNRFKYLPTGTKQVDYDDPWIKTLSKRDGFTNLLAESHKEVETVLSLLVEFYKQEVRIESSKFNKNKLQVDIDLAWELYYICRKCKMHEHPSFRVCAGFRAINESNPPNSQLMDRFRFMVHNKPEEKNLAKESVNLQNVQLILTQRDVKFFFLSFDVYKNIPGLHKLPFELNPRRVKAALNGTNITKKRGGQKEQKGCGFDDVNIKMEVLESGLGTNGNLSPGNVVVAWPTLNETVDYYIGKE